MVLPFLKKFFYGVLFIGFIAAFFAYNQIPDKKFHVYFLDVGQGDSIFIKTPENHQILIDGGPDNEVISELTKLMPFFDKSIDLVILTHPHSDHLAGLIEVLKRYKVENVLFNAVEEKSKFYEEFLSELEKQNIRIFVAESKSDFKFGKVVFDVLYPFEELINRKFANLNDSSIVIHVIYEKKSILLTGDLQNNGESELILDKANLKSDILKVGHHGSKNSSSENFLNKITPETAVIQVGMGNEYGHPAKETLDRLKKIGTQIFRTDADGTLEFTL